MLGCYANILVIDTLAADWSAGCPPAQSEQSHTEESLLTFSLELFLMVCGVVFNSSAIDATVRLIRIHSFIHFSQLDMTLFYTNWNISWTSKLYLSAVE